MTNYLYNDRSKSIELLQYYFFIKKNTNENSLIQGFLDSLNNHRYWQFCKVKDYLTILHDSIFCQFRENYLENMENSVAINCKNSEFVGRVYYILLPDKLIETNLAF